jgi:hypothetical protein
MMRYSAVARSVVLGLLIFVAGIGAARLGAEPGAVVGSGFSYQGQLVKDGLGYTGTCDMTFGLWDAASGGSQLGGNQSLPGVNVSNGVFTVILNGAGEFGASAFDGNARWLDVSVQCAGDGSPTGLGRQPLQAVPYALHAISAQSATTAQSAISAQTATTATNAVNATNAITAQVALSAQSATSAQTALSAWNKSGNAGTNPASDFLGTSDNQPLVFKTNNTESLRLGTDGKVGIGTSTLSQELTVQGSTRLLEGAPAALGAVNTSLNSPAALYVAGNYAYVANQGGNSLEIFDVSNPDSMTLKGSITTSLNGPSSVYVVGKYAFVTSYNNDSLVAFDVSTPTEPTFLDSISTSLDGPNMVYVAGQYAYVASELNDRFVTFEVSDPTNLIELWSDFINLNGPTSVYVAGRYAYLTSSLNNRLVIFDISDPASPVYKAHTTTTTGPQAVYVSGRYAYILGASFDRLQIFDIANPTSITALGAVTTNLDNPQALVVAGKYAYVASYNNDRLAVFDISNPSAPVAVGFLATNLDGPSGLAVSGKHVYVASQLNNTLAAFEANHLDAPTLTAGHIQAGGFDIANNAIVNNDFVVGSSLHVGGSAEIRGPVAVAGEISGQSLDVSGTITVNQSKPVLIKRFANVGNDANFDTTVSASDYECVAAGWSATYDIQESDARINMVWTYTSGSTWWARVQFASHNDDENPDVDILCFRTEIAEFSGTRSLNSPN